jgi:hypothetical protein
MKSPKKVGLRPILRDLIITTMILGEIVYGVVVGA